MNRYKFWLQFFGEGGADGASAGADGGEAAAQGSVEAGNAHLQEEVAAEETQRDFDSEWKELKKGDFKSHYEKDIKAQVERRLKGFKEKEGRLNQLEEVAGELADRYGINVNNIDEIKSAIAADRAFIREQSYNNGVSEEEQENRNREKAKFARMEHLEREMEAKKQRDETINRWMQQAETAKATYGDLNLEAELNDEETGKNFRDLLIRGVPVKQAYELVHMDAIMEHQKNIAVKQATQATVNNIRANGMRPVENGMSAQTPAVQKADIEKMGTEEINKIFKRVAAGEKIDFIKNF